MRATTIATAPVAFLSLSVPTPFLLWSMWLTGAMNLVNSSPPSTAVCFVANSLTSRTASPARACASSTQLRCHRHESFAASVQVTEKIGAGVDSARRGSGLRFIGNRVRRLQKFGVCYEKRGEEATAAQLAAGKRNSKSARIFTELTKNCTSLREAPASLRRTNLLTGAESPGRTSDRDPVDTGSTRKGRSVPSSAGGRRSGRIARARISRLEWAREPERADAGLT